MKRNDWILASAVLMYSLMFYNQTAGINFLFFSIGIIICLLIKDATLISKANWRIAALGSVLSGVCVALHGNTLAVVANIISLSLLSGLSFETQASVIFSLLHSAYSYLTSPVFIIMDSIESKSKETQVKAYSGKKLILVIVPALITLIFFFMYRSSSTLFDALAAKINWSFISWNWIMFTIGGLLLLYAFFNQKRIGALDGLDANASNNLTATDNKPFVFFGREINIIDENYSGTLLFALLNLLLLIVNFLDVDFMFGSQKLPLGVSPKQFVHQGTNMLITSIIIAIAIILFYFRAGLNFYAKNKTIKILACLWVAQNAFMLFSTACRNHLYITELGLTYKRIGVYVYLLLTLIGLITTLMKIINAKTNMFLFRKNGWLFYGLLIVFSFPNWDRIITQYNVNNIRPLDSNYLLSLSKSTLPGLLPYYEDRPDEMKMTNDSVQRRKDFDQSYCQYIYGVLYNHQFNDFRSWNYDDAEVYNDIISKAFCDKITMLDFSHFYLTGESFKLFAVFDQVADLRLCFTKTFSLKEINCFPNLKKLDLRFNSIADLSGVESLKSLECLDLRYDHIHDFSPLYKLSGLKNLYVGDIADEDYDKLRKALPNTHIGKFNNL